MRFLLYLCRYFELNAALREPWAKCGLQRMPETVKNKQDEQ